MPHLALDFTFTFVSTRFISYFLCFYCYFLNFYFWNDAGQQALMPYLVVTTRVHALLPFQRHVPWCIAGGASVIYNMFHPVLRCSSSSADGARVLSIYQGYFPLLPCSSFHIGLWSSVLPFFVCFTKLYTFISYFYYPSPPQLPYQSFMWTTLNVKLSNTFFLSKYQLDQVHLACRTQLLLPGLVAVVHHVHVHHVTWKCHIWYPWPPCF